MNQATAERFWAKVDMSGPVPDYAPHLGPCWIWTAGKQSLGYGAFHRPRGECGSRYPHRIIYEWVHGPIAAGLFLDHLCRVPACCRPTHLEPVTPRENVLRGLTLPADNVLKETCPRGHPYDEENTYPRPEGGRGCRICRRLLNRESCARRRAREREARRAALTVSSTENEEERA